LAATPRRGGRRRQARSAKAILAWALLGFVALHVGVHTHLERRHPEAYDPEFAARLAVLRDRIAETPDRPLLLVVGSSRLVTDFLPERLPPLQGEAGDVLAFNFSHTGAGPLINLMEVRRLLREGVKPRWLVVEVLPSMLNISGRSTAASLAVADDLPLLCRHMPSWKAYGRYLGVRLVPSTRHYLAALQEHGPAWAFAASGDELPDLGPLGGSTPLKAEATRDNIARCTAAVRAQYYPGLQDFRVTDVADQSLRELITLCREEQVAVVLVLTPESSEFRGWYPETTWQVVQDYCARLSRQYAVPVIDARTWLPDEDFLDAHHALPRGAETFTLRLGREVLQPLIRGDLH
jgi:uncharacterized protein DUF1574